MEPVPAISKVPLVMVVEPVKAFTLVRVRVPVPIFSRWVAPQLILPVKVVSLSLFPIATVLAALFKLVQRAVSASLDPARPPRVWVPFPALKLSL